MSETWMSHMENYWQEKTETSNELFHEANYEQALSGYKDALYRAEVLNNHISGCLHLNIPFIQIYIISCNNIASTCEALGKMEEAEVMLKRAVYYLLQLSGNKELDNPEILAELKRAVLSYTSFTERTGHGYTGQEQLFNMIKEQFSEDNFIKNK